MQNEDDLRGLAKVMDFMRAISILFVVINIYRRAVFQYPVHQTFFGGISCAFLFGYKGSERGKNHMEQDLCVPDNRFYPVLPELVAVGFALAIGGKYKPVHLYHDSRVSFPFGCRSMDFTFAEKQPDG